MPTISIITAVGAGRADYLSEAYESLRRQRMPAGWSWEWVIQEDGESGDPRRYLPEDERIHFDTGRVGRASMARTIALSRATGVLMRTLDADDMLPDDALADDITALVARPGIAWCVSATLDYVMPDGDLVPGPYDPSAGLLPNTFLYDGEERGELQVVGTTMCTYTELVRALGGWMALPASEDVELLLAAEAVSPGYMRPGLGLLYRQWPGASTEDPDYARDAESQMRRSALLQRADALRSAGWTWQPTTELREQLRALTTAA